MCKRSRSTEELQKNFEKMAELDGQSVGGDESNSARAKTPTRGEDRWEDVEDDEGKPAKKKIKIAQIDDKRARQTTFTKRKQGLIKKARELSVLCGCDIAILMTNIQGKLLQFDTGSMDRLLSKYHDEGASERYSMRETLAERMESSQNITPSRQRLHSSSSTDSFDPNSMKGGMGQEPPSASRPGSGMAGQHEAPQQPSSSMAMVGSGLVASSSGHGKHRPFVARAHTGHGTRSGLFSDAGSQAPSWSGGHYPSRFHSAAGFGISSISGGSAAGGSMARDQAAGSAVHRPAQGMDPVRPHAVQDTHQHQTLAQAQIQWQQQQLEQQHQSMGIMLPAGTRTPDSEAHFHALFVSGQPMSAPEPETNWHQNPTHSIMMPPPPRYYTFPAGGDSEGVDHGNASCNVSEAPEIEWQLPAHRRGAGPVSSQPPSQPEQPPTHRTRAPSTIRSGPERTTDTRAGMPVTVTGNAPLGSGMGQGSESGEAGKVERPGMHHVVEGLVLPSLEFGEPEDPLGLGE